MQKALVSVCLITLSMIASVPFAYAATIVNTASGDIDDVTITLDTTGATHILVSCVSSYGSGIAPQAFYNSVEIPIASEEVESSYFRQQYFFGELADIGSYDVGITMNGNSYNSCEAVALSLTGTESITNTDYVHNSGGEDQIVTSYTPVSDSPLIFTQDYFNHNTATLTLGGDETRIGTQRIGDGYSRDLAYSTTAGIHTLQRTGADVSDQSSFLIIEFGEVTSGAGGGVTSQSMDDTLATYAFNGIVGKIVESLVSIVVVYLVWSLVKSYSRV